MCTDPIELVAVFHHNPTAAAATAAAAADAQKQKQQQAAPAAAADASSARRPENAGQDGGWGVDAFGLEVGVIEEVCRALNVTLIIVPFDVQSTQNHQILLEWIWHNEVLPKYAHEPVTVVLTEVDVFPARPFSVTSILGDGACHLGGLRMDAFATLTNTPEKLQHPHPASQPPASCHAKGVGSAARDAPAPRHLWYMHPGFMFFDMLALPEPQRMCFVGLNLSLASGEHVLADTGGCSYLYLTRFQTASLHPGRLEPERERQSGEGARGTRKPLVVDGQEAADIKAFYQEYAVANDRKDTVGFLEFVRASESYSAFDVCMETSGNSTSSTAARVTACWLPPSFEHEESERERLHGTGQGVAGTGEALLPYLCSLAKQTHTHTHARTHTSTQRTTHT